MAQDGGPGEDDEVQVKAGTEPATSPEEGTMHPGWCLPLLRAEPQGATFSSQAWALEREHWGEGGTYSDLLTLKAISFQLPPWEQGETTLSYRFSLFLLCRLPAWLFVDDVGSQVHALHLFCFSIGFTEIAK